MFKFNVQDHYFKQAKKEGYKARSAFKLEEINEKFHLFDKKTKTIMDVWCAPGSWIQYAVKIMNQNKISDYKILGVDIQDVNINLPWVTVYKADISDEPRIQEILQENKIEKLDLIQCDMAPNTMGVKDVDAMRLFELLEYVKIIIKNYLKPDGKFVIKVFMGPWFEEIIKEFKTIFGGKCIKTLKPKSCRKESKETYLIKI